MRWGALLCLISSAFGAVIPKLFEDIPVGGNGFRALTQTSPSENADIESIQTLIASRMHSALAHGEGPMEMETEGGGDPEGTKGAAAAPVKMEDEGDAEVVTLDSEADKDGGATKPKTPDPPLWLPPLQCRRDEWDCKCVRECECLAENQMSDAAFKKPLLRLLGEEGEHLPPGFSCKCHLSQCECTANSVCAGAHRGEYTLNFIGGYLVVEDYEPYQFDGTKKFTIEMWIKVPPNLNDPGRVRCILDRFNYGVSGQYRIWMQNYRIFAQRETKDGKTHRVASAPIPPDMWVHVAVVYTGQTLVLLVNGVTVSMRSSGQAFSDSRSKLVFGACMAEGTFVRGFQGKIDEIRIWDEALTKDVIIENMGKRIDHTSIGLVGLWRLNLGTGRAVADWTKNRKHAKMMGTLNWQESHVDIKNRLTDVESWRPAVDQPSCGLPSVELLPPGDIAVSMPTTQSSTACGGKSERAVDGHFDPNYNQQHCTHTTNENAPYWRVDFGTNRVVGSVEVLNRGDCCGARLNGFQVFVGNSARAWRDGKRCGGPNNVIGQGQWGTVTCDPPRDGRYLFIAIPNGGVLTLCGVRVFSPPDTERRYIRYMGGVGVNGWQPTTGWGGDAHRAIDGAANGIYWKNHCTHTNWMNEPRWRADFHTQRLVGHVKVMNRADCCGSRLNGFRIYVGFDPDNWRNNANCGEVNYIGQGQQINVHCNPPRYGNYMHIVLPNRFGIMTLCNVEIYAPGFQPISTGWARCGEGFELCSLRQLKNAETMGMFDDRWGLTTDGVEARIRGKCPQGSRCELETLELRNQPWWGDNRWCCEPPEYLKYIAGPIPRAELQKRCSDFGGMWSPCNDGQLKSADTLGYRKCEWGRYSSLGRDIAVCGNCGAYEFRPGECQMETLRTTPRAADHQGLYCCHLGCS